MILTTAHKLFDCYKKLQQSLVKFSKAESGVSALEFAMLAPPFFLILGAIFETGLMIFSEMALQSAVQDASRLIRTGQAQEGGFTEAQFKEKICDTVGVIIDCNGKVSVYVRADDNFAALAANLPDVLNIGAGIQTDPNNQTPPPPGPTCYNPGQASQPAAIVATYDWKFSMLGMSFLGNIGDNSSRRLVGMALFQNEPFPTVPAGGQC